MNDDNTPKRDMTEEEIKEVQEKLGENYNSNRHASGFGIGMHRFKDTQKKFQVVASTSDKQEEGVIFGKAVTAGEDGKESETISTIIVNHKKDVSLGELVFHTALFAKHELGIADSEEILAVVSCVLDDFTPWFAWKDMSPGEATRRKLIDSLKDLAEEVDKLQKGGEDVAETEH